MKNNTWASFVVVVASTLGSVGVGVAYGRADLLGSARGFAVFGGATVTNTGPTVVTGSVGVSPGSSITGFPPGVVTGGEIHAGDAVAAQARIDITVAYAALAGLVPTSDLTGVDLGGRTLGPGVYSFSSSAFLTGTLTLDAMGDADARFVFQIGSTLVTATDASVVVLNGVNPCEVYWQVGSSATLGTSTDFVGNVVAQASITLGAGSTLLDGRALAIDGAVTMDTNLVTAGCLPSPGSAGLPVICALSAAGRRRRDRA